MFQQILVVVDRSSKARSIQTAFRLSQAYGSKLSLLHLETVEDAPLLLFSELNRPKFQIDLKFQNASTSATSTLIRPTTKLKVIGTEPFVFNHLQGTNEEVTHIAPHAQSLGTTNTRCSRAIVDVVQFCKADLLIIGLSQYLNFACVDFVQAVNCPILVTK